MIPFPGFAVTQSMFTPREGASTGLVFMLQILALVAIFWFLLIRPQQKEQKRHQAMLAAIKRGDEVVTGGGIVGRVEKVADDQVTIVTAESTRLVVQRARIATVVGREG